MAPKGWPAAYAARMVVSDLTDRAGELAHRGLDVEAAHLEFDHLLRNVISYRAAAWSTHDPATGLFTSCTLTGVEEDREREARLFGCEFIEDEPASCLSLIAQRKTVSVLSEVTGGDLARAARFREIFSAFGVTDELRAIFWADDRAWGSVSLYRTDGTFSETEAAAAAQVAPFVARAVRFALLRLTAARPDAVSEPPGIFQAGPAGTVVALTNPAHRWLELGGTRLVTAVNVTAAAVRRRGDWAGAASRLLLPSGRMLSLQAASMTSQDGDVAVIVDVARPLDVGAMLVDAYGLTPRQREVLGLLLLGRSPAEIGQSLGISEYTVNDHRKAIYQCMNVSSRAELAALLQSEQYNPRSYQNVPPSPYGGFLPT